MAQLLTRWHRQHNGCPVLRVLREGRESRTLAALCPMQAAWRDKPNSTGSIAAHPCKKRKDGAPTVSWHRRNQKPGPPRQGVGV